MSVPRMCHEIVCGEKGLVTDGLFHVYLLLGRRLSPSEGAPAISGGVKGGEAIT